MKLYNFFYGKNFIENFFLFLLYLFWIIYIISTFTNLKYKNSYISNLKDILKIFISLLLIYKFNPYNSNTNYISRFDKRIIFESGLFLLSTNIITNIINYLFIY